MRTWLAPSITATKAFAVLSLAILLPVQAPAGDSLERIVGTAKSIVGATVPRVAEVRSHCGSDPLCAAKLLAEKIGSSARLERVVHPDTDQIRGVRSRPSVTGATLSREGAVEIKLDRFGRTAVREFRDRFQSLTANRAARRLILDLRANHGGDFKRMLKLAALFTGPVADAINLHGKNGITRIEIPKTQRLKTNLSIVVLVGPRTASSAEILAALLRVHAGAEIVGSKTFGKNYLHRIVPVNHDWRLLVPAERIEVPGATLAGGLVPDRSY